MGRTPSAKHLPQLIHYPDAELKPTSKQQGGVVNDHMTLVLITAAPVDGVIVGIDGHYFDEMTGDAINNSILDQQWTISWTRILHWLLSELD